ncbi:hypothetical protein EJB05_48365 [Eragrostis curvula]|uniref:Potassium transporter n=1 Tax=Eragrostis curvula TaxID=38414 RepID=A0A5J9T3Y7_9POAL|nr:hypothetical protein EJB05_48365 [Eragrostis curvula]
MEHRVHDDVIVQVNAAAVAAVDERSSTSQIEEAIGDDGAGKAGAGITRRTFSESYKMRHRNPVEFTKWQVLLLSYQSLGVVYGDIGTSPLYTFSSFTLTNPGEEDFLGILSLILWTLTLISLVKYVLVVLDADDHGEVVAHISKALFLTTAGSSLLLANEGLLLLDAMEHRVHDDVIVQVNAAAVAAVDERSSTSQIEEAIGDDGAGKAGAGITRRTFSESYKMRHRNPVEFTKWQVLLLSYQSLGVVYGDIGTSPLYTFSSFTLTNPGEEDFLGILSLILWTLTLISLVKYVLVVLDADDHGEGGTFALYSLLRQHVNFKGSMPVPVTRLASDINLKFHSKKRNLPSRMHEFLEGSTTAQAVITYIVLVGTCMVIGDGALTPSISVLSAVQGIQSRSSKITQNHVVILCVIILIFLFLFQRYGTSKVSFTFSPIMLMWFALISFIGVYNIIKYYPPVLKAVSPHYIYIFFARNKRAGWEQLGTVVLCITGAEAMFADLGHFNKSSIQMAFSFLVYPSLILAYAGQAAFLIKNPSKLSTTFYSSIPEPLFWPMFIVATLAAIVASQALISASFSIIRQSVALGCFPRVTMKHTSEKYEGQVYSPEVNYFLMIVCILITVGFKGGPEIGQAYGVAVIWVMLITTNLITVVMVIIWQFHIALAGSFFAVYTTLEGLITVSLLNKIAQGGWVPFAITAFFLIITLSWTYGRRKKNEYEASNLMDKQEFIKIVTMSNRVPGICIFCTDLMNGIPPIVRHYVHHMGCLRELMVFVTLRDLPVTSVLPEERFLIDKLEPFGVYRCIVQYGYMDSRNMDDDEYVISVIASLKEIAENEDEIMATDSALVNGSTFVHGRIILNMSDNHNCFKRFVINNLYRFLQKNFRSNISGLKIAPVIHTQTKIYKEENIGTPGMVTPESTMKMLPVTYDEASWTRKRTSDVNAGSVVPCSLSGTIFEATVFNHLFCNKGAVISDLNSPGAIVFTLMPYAPNSKAISCTNIPNQYIMNT